MSDEDEEEGGDETEEDGEGDGEGGGRSFSPLRIGLFVGVPVLLIVGGLVAAYLFGVFDGLLGGEEEVVEEEAPILVEPVAFVEMEPITVNLAADGGQRALLQLSMSLEVANEEVAAAVEAILPRVVDSFQVFLRELRIEDLAGTRGAYRLKEELLTRVNAAAAPLRVEDVLFREMLVQ